MQLAYARDMSENHDDQVEVADCTTLPFIFHNTSHHYPTSTERRVLIALVVLGISLSNCTLDLNARYRHIFCIRAWLEFYGLALHLGDKRLTHQPTTNLLKRAPEKSCVRFRTYPACGWLLRFGLEAATCKPAVTSKAELSRGCTYRTSRFCTLGVRWDRGRPWST